jgi:hypothetical protein
MNATFSGKVMWSRTASACWRGLRDAFRTRNDGHALCSCTVCRVAPDDVLVAVNTAVTASAQARSADVSVLGRRLAGLRDARPRIIGLACHRQ